MIFARAHQALRSEDLPETREHRPRHPSRPMNMTTRGKAQSVLVIAALAALAGCSGGGPSSSVAPARAAVPGGLGTASVTFAMHWTAGSTTSAARRQPAYVPASARSVAISVNGGTAQYLNSPSTTLVISAPAGVDTFLIQTFDEQNGQGNVLSRAAITQTVALDTANVLSATLNGVVTAVQVTLGTPTPNAGAAASSTVVVAALDADGNTIVGPGDYSTPIKLSVVDPSSSGTVSLSTTLVQTPGTPVTLTYTGGTLANALVSASATGVTTAGVLFAPKPTIYEYPLANSGSQPFWITPGPDGNMWFTEIIGNNIAKITPAGVITEYPVPTVKSGPLGITAGQDGALWFTETKASKIGRVTTSGGFVELPTASPNDGPVLIIERGDGSVWYTGGTGSDISVQQEVAQNNRSSFATVTPAANPQSLTSAPDGNVYWTETTNSSLGNSSIGAAGETSVGGNPSIIVTGPDGNLWYTDQSQSQIVQFSPGSKTVLKRYQIPTLNANPVGIVVGKDSALWFAEFNGNKIGRITVSGALTEYPMPTAASGIEAIGVGPDGSIWVTESVAGKVARLVY
jgi:virginiamycin B lyase